MAKHTKRQPDEKRGRKPWQTCTLTIRHSINGKQYGPGVVKVHPDLAAMLMEQESRFRDTEDMIRKGGGAIIGYGNRIIPVNPAIFDAPDMRVPETHIILAGERPSR